MREFRPRTREGEKVEWMVHGGWRWICHCGFDAYCLEDVGGHRASHRTTPAPLSNPRTKDDDMTSKAKITTGIVASLTWGDVVVEAYGPDGVCLARHISSDENFAKLDIGLTTERKHDAYRAAFPSGYEVVWTDGDPRPEAVR